MHRIVALCLAFCLCAVSGTVYARSDAQTYTYEECNRAEAEALQSEIEAIALAVLTDASNGVNIPALVDRQWQALELSAVFDHEVEAAITRVRDEEPYWERFLSGWSAERAEALAGRVSVYAFQSDGFQQKLDDLSTAIAGQLAIELEAMSARSASSALLCLRDYVGTAYSDTLFLLFESEVSQEFEPSGYGEQSDVAISPADVHLKALGGIGVIVITQLTRKTAQALGKRIAGRVAGRLAGRLLGRLGSSVVPLAGWVIGAGLIVWDLVEGADGALPQIRVALQSEEVKERARSEIALAVQNALVENVHTIAAELASTLDRDWQEFCTRHAEFCTLASENGNFRTILDEMPLGEVDRLSQLVDVMLVTVGREEFVGALSDGVFLRLWLLPELALELLRWTESPQTVLAWSDLAGEFMEEVVESEVYKYRAPEDLSPQLLDAIVTIDSNDIIHKLLMLESDELEVLLMLSSGDLASIATFATEGDLKWLAAYLVPEEPAEARRVGRTLADGSLTVAELRSPAKVETAALSAAVNSPAVVVEDETVAPVVAVRISPSDYGLAIGTVVLFLVLLAGAYILIRHRNSLESTE